MKRFSLLLLAPFFLSATAPTKSSNLAAYVDPAFSTGFEKDKDSLRYDGSLDARLNAGIYYARNHHFIYQFDLLLPFYRDERTLVYGDVLVINPNGKELQMSGGVGFRHIKASWMWGGFAFFDRLKSPGGHFFNQLVFGGSLQSNDWWFNLMGFFPFHNTSQITASHNKKTDYYKNILFQNSFEKILTGVDAEASYGIFPDKNLRVFVGGFYYKRKGMPTVVGPRLRVTYRVDHIMKNSVRFMDYITFEGMIRHDKPRGTNWYVGARLTIPLGGKSKRHVIGLERYMNDYVRHDIN